MIILICKKCNHLYLLSPKNKGFIAHCPKCSKDLDLHECTIAYADEITEESSNGDLHEYDNSGIQASSESVQQEKSGT